MTAMMVSADDDIARGSEAYGHSGSGLSVVG